MSKCKRLFLVVIYNTTIDTSETLRSLRKYTDFSDEDHLFVWENTFRCALNSELIGVNFPQFGKTYYRHSLSNSGLSYVYNYIIDTFSEHYDYFIWFDHDSKVTFSYLDEMKALTGNNMGHLLILPKITFQDCFVSPARLFYFWGAHFKEIRQGWMSTKYLTAINSGMIISTRYFREVNFRYDENLKFYCTDDNFMIEFSKYSTQCYIMQSTLTHILDYFSASQPLNNKARRFKDIMRGMVYLNRHNLAIHVLAYCYAVCRSIIESIKFRSIRFFYI